MHYSRKPAPTKPHHEDNHHDDDHHQEAIPTLSYDYEEAPLQQYFQSRSLKAVMETAETMLSLYRHFRSDTNDVTSENTPQYQVTKPVKTQEYVVTKGRRNL